LRRPSSDDLTDSGNAETSFGLALLLPRKLHDGRVHDRMAFPLSLFSTARIGHKYSEGDSDLRGGEAGAFCEDHRVEHVLHEVLQGFVEDPDLPSLLAENRIP
jgi:hypothetical protein